MHARQGALVWRVPVLGPAEHVVDADSGLVENLWPGAAVEGSYATLGWRTRSRVQIAIFRLILKPYAVQPPDPDNHSHRNESSARRESEEAVVLTDR